MNTKNNFLEKYAKYSNKELFEVYRDNKEIEIRNELVERNIKIIDYLVKKYLNKGIEYDDLYQVGAFALIKAVERFDVDKGFEFSSCATPTIIGEIKKHFRDKGWAIRVPRRIQELSQKVNKAKETLTTELQRPPMVSEIAEYLEVTENEVLEAMESSSSYDIKSIDNTVNGDDGKTLTMEDVIGKEDTSYYDLENQDFLDKALETFKEIEKEIFIKRYQENRTQSEIAKELGVSQMTISRIEKKIIEKFKREIEQI